MSGDNHHIVAIGASAGGLEAIHEFFDNTPEHKNVSYVIIQHLSPDYKSLLVELVSRHTHMKVFEAENNTTVEKNCIYVIPNNKLITIKGDKLFLEEKGTVKVPNNAIDVFLYSLARDKRRDAIAVILSGTGTDGTKGIEEIKKHGGLVIVQDPATAKFDGMPNSAIHSGNVDFVLSPADMHEEITNYTEDENSAIHLDRNVDDELLQRIFVLIHQSAGFDFNYYKTPTIIRRIERRMLRSGYKDIKAYVNWLEDSPEEAKQLGRDFLIGVTKFFRDPSAFEFLEKKVLEPMLAEKETGDTVKVWVTACSTGEEAYSIAILINDIMERLGKSLEVKIFATDLEESNVEIASRGVYPESIEQDVLADRLSKYFIKSGRSYVIIPKIRKQIVFANHNIVKDPPFIKNDLVSCRNMLIYMNPILQQRVYALLLFSVKRDGFLFFGSSENPSYVKDAVIEIHPKWKIFKKIAESKLSVGYQLDVPEKKSSQPKTLVKRPNGETSMQGHLWNDFRQVLQEELLFAAIYIDANFDIKDAIGNYERVLYLPKKNLRLNLLRMVPQSLSAVLNSGVNKCIKTRNPVKFQSVKYDTDEGTFSVQVYIKQSEEVSGCTIVVFSNHQKLEISESRVEPAQSELTNSEYVRSLESELIEVKNNLQIVVEDLETVNEELQSSNEELLSANEELQSSNEELQSLNEELHTLNTEHQLKIKELLELNDDLNNYFRSTDIGQIFLTRDARIRKFNPASARMINFIDSDIGRPLTHISTNIKYTNLTQDVITVIENNTTVEKEVQLVNGKNLLMRILPYVTRDNQIDGAIISFVDITIITNLNNIIRGVFNSSQSAIFALQAVRDPDHAIIDFAIVTVNYAAQRFLKTDSTNYAGRQLKSEVPTLTSNGMFDKFVQVVQDEKVLHTDVFIESDQMWYEVSAVKMTDGLVATLTDITEKKVSEQRLKKNYVELVSVKDNLKKLNTELENKVRERTRELSLSEERFRMVSQATNDAIWDWDFLNNKLWWGDGFYKLFGHDHDDKVLERSFWLKSIHPEDRNRVRQGIDKVINSSETQWSCEYRFGKADGSYAHVLDRGYVLHDEYGTPYRMLGSMLDLTELKRTEQELLSNIQQRHFLAESMPLIVCTAAADLRIDFINSYFETYTGLQQNQAIGHGWHTAIHRDDLKVLLQGWKNAIQSKTDFEREVRVKHNEGDYHWNIIRAKARVDKNGDLLNWVITLVDINSQKLINETLEKKVLQRTEQLQRINNALEASNHDLQQFASVASHDLQEPLRKIHMFSKLIRDKHVTLLPEDAQIYLEKIMQASARMKSIITNVLNFSRLSADDNNFELVDLKELVYDLVEDLEVTIKERNAKIEVSTSARLQAIRGQIRQVFQNLVSNSLKFSKPDSDPAIRIESEFVKDKAFDSPASEDGPFVRITVSDNGIGFDDKFKENIFTLFHRLHSKDSFEGTGIGLAIVKKIVEKHGGLITARSKMGDGATFVIVLPVYHEQKSDNKISSLIYNEADTARG